MLSSSNENRESHKTGGGKKTTQGTTYHLELLMLMFLRGLGCGYQFDLATEMEDAGKFDDIVFRYDSNGKRTYTLIQIKHKAESSRSKITLSALLSTSSKADYGVLTYFNSFRKVKREFLKGGEELRAVMIYTNGDFKWEDKQQMFKMDGLFVKRKNDVGRIEKDDLLMTELLYFTEDVDERRKWVDFLKENISEDLDQVEEDATLYLDKFAFAVKQPDEKDLSSVIMHELKVKYKITDLNAAYSLFRDKLHKWMTSPEGYYLKHTECRNFVEHLMKKYGAISFGSHSPAINFTGREEELEELKEAHRNGTATVAVTGLGGIGKTQLVKKFVACNLDCFDSVAWMNGESREDLMYSFRRLAVDKLGINEMRADGQRKDFKSILEEVYHFFRYRKCIIVFDNASYSGEQETEKDYVLEFSPKSTPQPFLIITSRYQSWENLKVMKLIEFTDDDARDLIKTSLGHELSSDENEVTALARELHNYPLALQQALAYIKKMAARAEKFGGKRGISHYLELYEMNCKTLLDEKVGKFSGDKYEKTTCNTWDITLEDVRKGENGILAERILKLASYLPPDAIDRKEINKCFQGEDEETIKSSLLLLDDYSMVTMENDKMSMHRLVQKITRMRTRAMGEEKGLIMSALRLSLELEVQNSISLWGYAMGYEDLVKDYLQVPKCILKTFKDIHRYEEGRLFGDRFIPKIKAMLGTTENALIEAMTLHADLTFLDGKLREAFELCQEVCNYLIINLGLEHPDTLAGINNMASVLINLGRQEESLQIIESIHKYRQGILGESLPDAVISFSNIATMFSNLGRLEESVKLERKRKGVLGEEHPDTLNRIRNAACVLGILGRNEDSLKLHVKVHEKQKLVLGEEHSETLGTMGNMALVLSHLGRYQESLNLTEEVYQKTKSILGESHPITLLYENNLATVLHDLGRSEESLRLIREVYEKMTDVLGVDHPDTLNTMCNMASMLQNLQRHEECLKWFEEACERMRRVLGDEHSSTLTSMGNMATALQSAGRLEESLKIMNEVYEIRVRISGREHLATLKAMTSMASVLDKLGRYEESLRLSEVAIEKLKGIVGNEHPDILTGMNNIATLLCNLGRYELFKMHFPSIPKLFTGENVE